MNQQIQSKKKIKNQNLWRIKTPVYGVKKVFMGKKRFLWGTKW